MSLAEKMREAGLSSGDLADLAGLPRSHVAAFKSGGRTLGQKAARKIAPHLDAHPMELIVENRLTAMRRAAREGDARGVVNAIRSIVEKVEKVEKAEEGDVASENLDKLVIFAEEYIARHIIASDAVEDDVLEDGNSLIVPTGTVSI